MFAVCKLAWVPVVGSILGSLLFLLPDQSQDAIRALLSDTHWKGADFAYVALFLAALLLWAVSAHVWARMTTMHRRALNKLPRDYDDGIARQCLDTVPRLVGFGVFFMMAVVVACVVVQLPHWVYVLTGLRFVPLMGVLAIRCRDRDRVGIKWTHLLYAALVSLLVLALWMCWGAPVDVASFLFMVLIIALLTLLRRMLFWFGSRLARIKWTYLLAAAIASIVVIVFVDEDSWIALVFVGMLIVAFSALVWKIFTAWAARRKVTSPQWRILGLTWAFFIPAFLLFASSAELSLLTRMNLYIADVQSKAKAGAKEDVHADDEAEKKRTNIMQYYQNGDKVAIRIALSNYHIDYGLIKDVNQLGDGAIAYSAPTKPLLHFGPLLALAALCGLGMLTLVIGRRVDRVLGWPKIEAPGDAPTTDKGPLELVAPATATRNLRVRPRS